ncbi:MAG: polymorphic toxin-type HINT domain-containing protein, partial [Acidobacteriota bacterium]
EIKTYSYNDRHQLTAISHALQLLENLTFSFDANGNRTAKTQNGVESRFVFDALDRMTRFEEGGLPQGTYTFDYQGLRIKKQNATAVEYLYEEQSVLQRHDSAVGQITYDYGPDRLLSVDHPTEGRAFYLFDGLGSVVNLMTPGGSVQNQYSYDAWGKRRFESGTSGNVFGFTGHEEDAESGLIYARARFYDPDVGLFLSHDPVEGDATNPPSLHRYLYAYQNPTVYTDPTGRIPEEVEQFSSFLRGGGSEAATELAEGIGEEFGTNAGRASALILGPLGAFADTAAGIVDAVGTGLDFVVAGAAPNSEAGQKAAVDALETLNQASAVKNSLLDATAWAIENPEAAGALAAEQIQDKVESGIEFAGDVARGDIGALTKLTGAAAVAVAAGPRGLVTGALKEGLQTAVKAGTRTAADLGRAGVRATRQGVQAAQQAAKKARNRVRRGADRDAGDRVPEKKTSNQCFVAGTLVSIPTGLMPIEEVREGLEVVSKNEETGEVRVGTVVQVFVTENQPIWDVEVESADGSVETYGVTAEHPFHVEGLGWIPARKLEAGDPLVALNGETGLKVRQVRGSPRRETVYNFEVAEDHTYFVGEQGVWVHNDCDDSTPAAGLDRAGEEPRPISRGAQLRAKHGSISQRELHQRINLRGSVSAEREVLRETLSARQRGPVLSGILDTSNNEVFFGLNTEAIRELHPALVGRVLDSGVDVGDLHSEVVALNKALFARGPEAELTDLPQLLLFNARFSRNLGLSIPRCTTIAQCQAITRGVKSLSDSAP